MSGWNIYHKDGSELTDVNGEQIIVKELEYSDSWMGECYLTVSFKNNAPIDFQIGDYLKYRGERFELNYDPGKEKQARKDSYGEAFIYESVKLNALQDELTRTEFLDVVLGDNELHYTALPKFSFYVETLDDLLDRLQANLNEQIGTGMWKIFSRNKERSEQRGCTEDEWNEAYGEGTSDITIDTKSITIDAKTCWEALALVNSEWDVNFIVRGRNVYVGTAGVPTANIFKYGLGEGLYQVNQNADSDQSIITRLRAYGSEQNLPSHYYADLGIKYKCNITKVITADNEKYHNVEFLLDLDFVESYFKNQRTYTVSGKAESYGWVLQVTFDYKTIIIGYVLEDSSTKKCRFYSEVKGSQIDSGDEPSQESLDAFIAQVKSGKTLLYISSGVNKNYIPSANKEYADNLPNNMAINRLMLPGFPRLSLKEYYDSLSDTEKAYVNPNGKAYKFSTDKYRPYIDSPNIDTIGLRSGSQFFDTDDKTNGIIDIYPTIEEMEIDGVRVDEIKEGVAPDDNGRFEDGQTVPNVNIFLSPSIDFDITDLKDEDFSISMKDGMCGGRTFHVAATNKVDGRWRLTIERVKDDALELYFPYKDYPIKKGDHFVLTGIELPDSYVNAASLKLLKYALALLDKNDYTRYVYQPKVDEIFMARQHDKALADKTSTIKSLHDTLKAGDIMLFEDEDLGIDAQISIDQLSIKEEEGKIPTYEITLREDKEVGTIQKIKQQISSLESGNGGSGATTTQVKNIVSAEGSKYFLSKLNDDTAQGVITFLKGLKVGDTGNNEITTEGLARLYAYMTYGFNSGLYGNGASIDHKGNAELNSLFVRQFISTPKFVFNEIAVTKAEQWNTNGYGTIESVDTENQRITLKLEENDYGSLSEGDICRGIFADIDNAYGSDSTTEGALDDSGFVMHKGFFTTYFYVKRIITSEKGKFVFQYGKKSSSTPDPCAYMDFAQYGSFTDDQRQSSMYFSSRGRSYIEVLDGVNTWNVQPANRVCRYGYLGGLSIKKKDSDVPIYPEGNGIYVQDNVYFGGTVQYLGDIEGLDDKIAATAAYDVSLSQYQGVLTVDDMGNVIGGLYTEDAAQTTKQYKVSTAVFVRKGLDILLEEDDANDDVTEGHYRVYAVSNECTVEVENSTVFVTAIENIKDGVVGTEDDTTFDYDQMRKMTDAMVTVVVDLEGKTSKTVQMPIRIQHDSLPFMVCDLSNENASVMWNTKDEGYIGFPIETKVSLYYQNTPYAISDLDITLPTGLTASMSISGEAKVITIDVDDDLTTDSLPSVMKLPITVNGVYAGASYEYTKELTIMKSADTVIYEIVTSSDSIVADKDGNQTAGSVSCDVYATSSENKRYKLSSLPSGFALKYGYSDDAVSTSVALGKAVGVTVNDKQVIFALYDASGNVLDRESVPVLSFGKDGKGVEYIFKCTADNTKPSNPTPTDYATNTEYQRTDKEYIPSGWTDDPSGVTAQYPYEWVCCRTSTNGHWGAFSDPAEYAHFGKHAPCAKTSDDIVTIPTDSKGGALLAFSETLTFDLLVDGKACTLSSVTIDKSTLSNVSCPISSNKATVSCAKGASLGSTAQTLVFKVTGTLDGASYTDYVTVKVVPNVTGEDGDGYEYIYYRSNSSSAPSAPSRAGGTLTSGWYDDPMSPTDTYQYVYVAYKTGKIGSDGTFSSPSLFNRYPKSIDNEVTKYYTTTSGTSAPSAGTIWSSGTTSMPSDFNDNWPWLWKLTRTFYSDGNYNDSVVCVGYKAQDGEDGNGISSITTYFLISASGSGITTSTSGWGTSSLKPTASQPYLWSYTHIVYTNGGTYDTKPQVVGNYAADGKDGESVTGPRGPIPRTHTGLTKGDYYMSGADGEAYVDLVYYNKAWYRCKTSHTETATTPSTTYWEQSQTTGWTFMATELLLAETGYIKNLRTDDVYITEEGSGKGNILFIANKNGLTCNTGTFNNITATNANVTGKITATSGQIGDFTITSAALTTSISGALTTTSGGMFKNGSFWVRQKPYVEVCMGDAAISDLTNSDSNQKACDMYGSPNDSNATESTMIVRKYTKSTNLGSKYNFQAKPNDPAYAALNVDTDENPGIRSIGGNLFGSIAQSVISTISLTSSHYTAINNNRVGVVVMTNGAEQNVILPTSPMVGQMFTVIRRGAGNVRVKTNMTTRYIIDVGNSSGVTEVLVETRNNWARFLWDGSAWNYERSFYS